MNRFLGSTRNKLCPINVLSFQNRVLSTVLKINEKVDGDTITIDVEKVESDRSKKLVKCDTNLGTTILSDRRLKNLRFDDVLILQQFLRKDGTVLPRSVTKLSEINHKRIEGLVMQAHWAGLFPNHQPDNPAQRVDLSGFRKYNRVWNKATDLYVKNVQVRPGSWFYVRRYK